MRRGRLLWGIAAVGVLFIFGGLAYARSAKPDIASFLIQYDNAADDDRESIASAYLKLYPASELLSALDAEYPLCHTQGHPLGRAIYKADPNFKDAVATCANRCNNGCFHGALMEMFSTKTDTFGGVIDGDDPDSYLSQLMAVAHDVCERPEVAGLILPWSCVHGLGHVFAYVTREDLATSMKGCESLGSQEKKSLCAGGLFMEYMSDEKNEMALDQKNEFPCDKFPWVRAQCYAYKGAHSLIAWGSVKNAMDHCRTLGSAGLSCIRGIGFAVSRDEYLDTKDGLATECGGFNDPKETSACIEGAVFHVVANLDGSTNAPCDAMADPYRTECVRQLDEERNGQF